MEFIWVFLFSYFFCTYFSVKNSFYFCNKLIVKELSVIRTAVMYHFHTQVFKKYYSEITYRIYMKILSMAHNSHHI